LWDDFSQSPSIIGEKSIKDLVLFLIMKGFRIIRYDGYCNLCSATIRWVIRNDRKKRFSFQALEEGDEGSALGADTVVLQTDGALYLKSSAVLHIARDLRFPWPLLGILWLVPRFIRNAVYDLVARNRKRWFGTRSTCYVPMD
jgi:predicted DCC family thiol-disulfide oxidoreductase YuxK